VLPALRKSIEEKMKEEKKSQAESIQTEANAENPARGGSPSENKPAKTAPHWDIDNDLGITMLGLSLRLARELQDVNVKIEELETKMARFSK
jgi:hypothetical protein